MAKGDETKVIAVAKNFKCACRGCKENTVIFYQKYMIHLIYISSHNVRMV